MPKVKRLSDIRFLMVLLLMLKMEVKLRQKIRLQTGTHIRPLTLVIDLRLSKCAIPSLSTLILLTAVDADAQIH
jgi:hypothetical protein